MSNEAYAVGGSLILRLSDAPEFQVVVESVSALPVHPDHGGGVRYVYWVTDALGRGYDARHHDLSS